MSPEQHEAARNRGVNRGIVLLLLGGAIGAITSFVLHEPHIARFILAGGMVACMLSVSVALILVDHRLGVPIYFPTSFSLTVLCFPFYFILSGLEVGFGTRFIAAAAWLAIGIVLCVVCFWYDDNAIRRKLRQG